MSEKIIGPRRLMALAISMGCGISCLGQDKIAVGPVAVQAKVVMGLPFSALAVSESTQVLADGNRVVRTNKAQIARDREGRTRREQLSSASGETAAVFIQDPVAGVDYVLDARMRVARKVEIATLADPINTNVDQPPESNKLNRNIQPLGTNLIEGVLAVGTRITRTVPAGEQGNERPLEVVTEAWYSEELQIVVMNKTTDPRTGETLYKLIDIRRGDPEHSLFELPSDYTLRGHIR